MMGSKQDRAGNLKSEVANALQGDERPDRIHASRRRDSAFEWADGLPRPKWLSRVAPYVLAALG